MLKQRIAELIEQHGSLRAAARVLDVDAGYLSRLQSGEKNDPGETLLRRMGLVQHVTYTRKAERSAASTGADTERHGSNELNPTSAPALSLPIQRLGSAMEGLAEWHRVYAEYCRADGRPHSAPAHERWAIEVEALRQRPGAQAASEPQTKLDRFLGMVRVWVEREGGDMDKALAWMYASPAGERPAQAEPMTDEREAFEAFVRCTSPNAWRAEIDLAWEAWQTARERPSAQAPSTAGVGSAIVEAAQKRGWSPLAAPSTGGAETADRLTGDYLFDAAPAESPFKAWPPGSSLLQVAVAPHAAAGPYPTAMRPATAAETAAIGRRASAPAQAVETAGVREALRRNAERYLWLRSIGPEQLRVLAHYAGPALDDKIDAALQSPAASPASKEDGSHE